MPSLAPYVPARDSLLNTWAANFASLVAANPGSYGLTGADATSITSAQTTFAAAYTTATAPSTRTPTAVSNKNTDKYVLLATIRPYAQQVANNAGVSSSAKIALGVNPRTSTPTPITAPTTAPVLTAQSTSTAGTILRYRDATASPSVKSKPYGVTSIQIFATASATPITDPAELAYIGNYTKSPLTLAMGNANAGKVVYFAARWLTRKGLHGPWSPVIAYVVAG